MYRAMCEQASKVAVMTEWGKRDLVDKYGLRPEKVAVIPWAPSLQFADVPDEAAVVDARHRLRISGEFLLYPAQTWAHKNHIQLVRAVAQLKARGVKVQLICTGHRNEFFPRIEREIHRLHVESQVRFLDFVSTADLFALYRASLAVVFPSKFEGWGVPVTDAMYVGLPVVCSNLPVLCEQTGDAAVTFDPGNLDEMAAAIERVWQDEALRRELAARGRERARQFTWARTADAYRALYRDVAAQHGISQRSAGITTAEVASR